MTTRPAETAIYLTDVTTGNASTDKHGYLKKLSGVATEFLNGLGNFATPAAGGLSSSVRTGNRTNAEGTGTETISGLSFQPTACHLIASDGSYLGAMSVGFADSARNVCYVRKSYDNVCFSSTGSILFINSSLGHSWTATVDSYTSDGATFGFTMAAGDTAHVVYQILFLK